MKLKLFSRSETAGNDKLQLQFNSTDDSGMTGMGGGVSLSGWFDRDVAAQYTVGGTYELALTLVPTE